MSTKGNGEGPKGPDDEKLVKGITGEPAANDDIEFPIDNASRQGGLTIGALMEMITDPEVVAILEQLDALNLAPGTQPDELKLPDAEKLGANVTNLREIVELGTKLSDVVGKRLAALKEADPERITAAFSFVEENGDRNTEGGTLQTFTASILRQMDTLLSDISHGAVAATLDNDGRSDEDYTDRLRQLFHTMSAASRMVMDMPSLRDHRLKRALPSDPSTRTYLRATHADELIRECADGLEQGVQRIAREEGLNGDDRFVRQELAIQYYYQHLMGLAGMIMADAQNPEADRETLRETVTAFAEITLHSMNAAFATDNRASLLFPYRREPNNTNSGMTCLLDQVPQTPLRRSNEMIKQTSVAAHAVNLIKLLQTFQNTAK
ncbi:hypothetical protein KBD59_02195 [Candidatus Gracilibacteria bacterium]|nr:hypothetical protein [Candidatus Gracilibacteria bacterium]